MGEILTIIIIIYATINMSALLLVSLLSINDNANFSFVNPIVIYYRIDVNWFGAWLLALIANICLPIIAIPYWIYKICTVGR